MRTRIEIKVGWESPGSFREYDSLLHWFAYTCEFWPQSNLRVRAFVFLGCKLCIGTHYRP